MKKILSVVLTLLMLLGIIPALADESSTLSWVDDLNWKEYYELGEYDKLEIEYLNISYSISSDGVQVSLYRVVNGAEDVLVCDDVIFTPNGNADLSTSQSLTKMSNFVADATYYFIFTKDGESKASPSFNLYPQPYIRIQKNGTTIEGNNSITLEDSDKLSVDRSYIDNSSYYQYSYKNQVVCWLIKDFDIWDDAEQIGTLKQDTISLTDIGKLLQAKGYTADTSVGIYATLVDKNETSLSYKDVWDDYGWKLNVGVYLKVPVLPTTGDLSIAIGEVTGEGAPTDVSVDLEITLKKDGAPVTGEYGDVTFDENGVGKLTVSKSSSEEGISTQSAAKVITGIPIGTTYSIQSLTSGYSITEGATGIIGEGTTTVSLKMSYQPPKQDSNDAMVKDDEIRTEGGATNDDIEVTGKLKDNSDINVKDIYSVEINWGDMKFKYVTTQHKKNVWNAESHTYSTIDDADKPDDHEWKLYTASGLNLSEDAGKIVTGADQSYVVVFNHSNRPVDVQLANEASKVSGVTVNLVDKLNTGTDGVYALDAGVEGTVYDATTGAAAKVNVSGDPDDVNDLAQETEETSADNPTVLTQLKVTISKHTAAEEE